MRSLVGNAKGGEGPRFVPHLSDDPTSWPGATRPCWSMPGARFQQQACSGIWCRPRLCRSPDRSPRSTGVRSCSALTWPSSARRPPPWSRMSARTVSRSGVLCSLNVSSAPEAFGPRRPGGYIAAAAVTPPTPRSLMRFFVLVGGVLVVVGDQGTLDRGADLPVEPDRGVEGEQPLHHARPQPAGDTATRAVQAELVLQRPDDRLHTLAQPVREDPWVGLVGAGRAHHGKVQAGQGNLEVAA